MHGLDGIVVLVTRPEQQAAPLCKLLEERGAIALQFPVVRIVPIELTATRRAVLESMMRDADLVIFTSANAVKYGASLVVQTRAVIAAIGPATARALTRSGLAAAMVPEAYDSEGLLEDTRISGRPGQRVVLVKGRQGRELLQHALRERGADVAVAEVYAREEVDHAAATLEAIVARTAATGIDIITATSVDIAAHLHRLIHPSLSSLVERAHWLVPSARVATAVHGLGVTAPLLLAASAEDHDLVETLVSWRRTLSGA